MSHLEKVMIEIPMVIILVNRLRTTMRKGNGN